MQQKFGLIMFFSFLLQSKSCKKIAKQWSLDLPKFYGDSEGGGSYAFFTGTFPKKDHPPNKKFWTVPKSTQIPYMKILWCA